ncbi:MAG: hypothetical protein MUC92_09950 [Fimbriimonadaceae bacterium]|jgi:hypothetical protein|nr:hypothetical protein [Fimbriimonadaceae bacterium]
MAYLAIQGRFASSTWVPKEYGPKIHRDILCYQTPVAKTLAMVSQAQSFTQEDLDDVTQIWLVHAKAGTLRPIPTIRIGESGVEGVRQQIESARNRMMAANRRSAKLAEDNGFFGLAVERYLKVLELSQIGKYSSLASIHNSVEHQRAAIRHLQLMLPSLTQDDRSRISVVLELLDSDEEATLRLVTRTLGAQRTTDFLAQLEASDEGKIKIAELMRKNGWEDLDQDTFGLLGLARNALQNEERWAAELSTAQSEFGGRYVAKAEKRESWSLTSSH